MNIVAITGWKRGLNKVGLTVTIRKHTGLGLAEGKRCTDRILEGESVAFGSLSPDVAEAFLKDVRAVGAIGELQQEET